MSWPAWTSSSATRAGLRLVLCGRHAPGLALAKLRLSGQVADICAADLACLSQEADAYLVRLGVVADADTRAWLMQESEGWMAGLCLLSMTLQARAHEGGQVPGPGQATASVASGPAASSAAAQQLVTDYLTDEILAPLPDGAREFLLRTSLTAVVPTDLAQELTGDGGAAARLEQLSRENVLIRPVSGADSEFRYHPMLKGVLEGILRREHPDEVPGLFRRIARWHAGRGDVLPAIRAAARAGDWDFGALVLAEAAPVAPTAAGWTDLEDVLASFPPERRSNDGVLAAALAAARLWQGDPDGALPHLDCARNALDGDGDELTAARLWLAALTVMRLAGTAADLGDYWSLASGAHEESASVPEHGATGLLWLALGCASLRRHETQQARTALQHAGSQLAAGGLGFVRERARSFEAVAHASYGDLAAATRVAAEVSEGPAGGDPGLAPILALSQARAHLARDEPEAAAMLLDRADQAASGPQPAGEPVIGVLSGLVRTRIAIDEGNFAGARGLIRVLTEMTAGEQAAGMAIAALDAEVSLAAGERERARATLAGLPDGPGAWPQVMVCQARLLMADEDDKGAVKLLDPIVTDPPGFGLSPDAAPETGQAGQVTLSGRLSALLTTVLAHRRLSQATEAAQRLEEALALAEPDDLAGPFIAGGSPVRSALTVLITPASRCASFCRADPRPLRRAAAARRRPAIRGLADRERAGGAALPALAHDEPGDRRGAVPVDQHDQDSPELGLPQARRHQPAAGHRPGPSPRAALGASPSRDRADRGPDMPVARTDLAVRATHLAWRGCGRQPPVRLAGPGLLSGRPRGSHRRTRAIGDLLGLPAHTEGQAGEHDAVEQQPRRHQREQEHQRDPRPGDHEDPGGDGEDAQDRAQPAPAGPGRERDAEVGDPVHDEVHAGHERDQEQAERVVSYEV